MPLVLVSYGKKLEDSQDLIKHLTLAMPEIVARALDVYNDPTARLTAKDVCVSPMFRNTEDVNGKDLEIIVMANDYPERRKNLDDRRGAITRDIKRIVGETKITGSVWVRLCPGSYEDF